MDNNDQGQNRRFVVNGVACWGGIPTNFSAYHDPTTLVWTLRCDEVVTVTGQLMTDQNGNICIQNLIPSGSDVEILSVRGTNPSDNFTFLCHRDYSNTYWSQLFNWDGTKYMVGSRTVNVEVRYRRL